MSWLTFYTGWTFVDKGLVDEDLDNMLSPIEISINMYQWQSKHHRKPLRPSPGMVLHFIRAQRVKRLFEFLVGLLRCLHLRLSSRLQRIINDLIYPFKAV